jgi:hypothetical protein
MCQWEGIRATDALSPCCKRICADVTDTRTSVLAHLASNVRRNTLVRRKNLGCAAHGRDVILSNNRRLYRNPTTLQLIIDDW